MTGLQTTATPEEIAKLWEAARAADETNDSYGCGAFDMIQALTGNSDVNQLIANLSERGDE